MPMFNYRAMTATGELVAGAIDAPSEEGVADRVLGLGLIPIGAEAPRAQARASFFWRGGPRAEDVTVFTRDLALLLRTGARVNDALELLASDDDLGRMRNVAAALLHNVLSGQSFHEALASRPEAFPPLYVALVKVAEATSMLPSILEAIATERTRAEATRRKLIDALRYPAFLLAGASVVLVFFLTFVLPQFAAVFSDFNAKPDPVLATFLGLSLFLRENGLWLLGGLAIVVGALALALRRPEARAAAFGVVARLPGVGAAIEQHRAVLFCRNLGLLLSGGVTLSSALRILVGVMSSTSSGALWTGVVDHVRRGGKLSEALMAARVLPAMAVRTLRLGEDSDQLPMLAGRVADYYEVKLGRAVDRIVGVVGPAAIIVISGIVGALIVSVMTALLSVDQMVE
jgi:general secretion pathway protein F